MTGALAAEWLKVRSVRSTYVAVAVAAATVLLGVLFVLYAGSVWDARPPDRQPEFRAARPEQGFLPVVQLSLAVLGVLAITSEYATGMLRTSLTAVPRWRTVLAAKAVVVAGVALVVASAVLVGTFAAGRLAAGDRTMGFNTAPVADELPLLLASIASVVVMALLGLGFGAVCRSAAAAVTAVVGVRFLVPVVATLLPPPWGARLAGVQLQDLPATIAGVETTGGGEPAVGLVLLVGYAAVPLGVAAVLGPRTEA
ncbi:MAG TPA: ABC transporter permease [Pilimelia sp.]|nr:ABC transporter permease [Pilimelia sp.]